MALFTDGTISTIEDLAAQDSTVLDVANVEGINLTTKLNLARDEVGVELVALLARASVHDVQLSFQSIRLDNVVVTAPLKLWHEFHTLSLIYRDALNRQLNDRYRAKAAEAAEREQWARRKLIETGLGIVFRPVAQAAPPELASALSPQAAATYYAAVAWVNASSEEGAAGPWRALTVSVGHTVQVQAVSPPTNAAGWNVFVGFSDDQLVQQNNSALSPDQVWIQSGPPLQMGRHPGNGQSPNVILPLLRLMQRG